MSMRRNSMAQRLVRQWAHTVGARGVGGQPSGEASGAGDSEGPDLLLPEESRAARNDELPLRNEELFVTGIACRTGLVVTFMAVTEQPQLPADIHARSRANTVAIHPAIACRGCAASIGADGPAHEGRCPCRGVQQCRSDAASVLTNPRHHPATLPRGDVRRRATVTGEVPGAWPAHRRLQLDALNVVRA